MFGFMNRFSLNASTDAAEHIESLEAVIESLKGSIDTEAATEAAVDMGIHFDFSRAMEWLGSAGFGFLAIFIVMLVIILTIFLINYFTNLPSRREKKLKEAQKDNNSEA